MNSYRVIVCMHRHSDGQTTIPYDQNTLTFQSADTKDSPRNLLLGPVTICVQRLLKNVFPQHPTRLLDDFDVSSTLDYVPSNFFDVSLSSTPAAVLSKYLSADCDISSPLDAIYFAIFNIILSSTPDAVQYDVFLADCHVEFLHCHSFLRTHRFTLMRL